MIEAGQISQIKWDEKRRWIFIDIGFSAARRSCGIIVGDGPPECLTFGETKLRLLDEVSSSKLPLSLVIEAPLSVCFSKSGNPKGRKVEKDERITRYWYSGPGCAVMTAAIYLMKSVFEIKAALDIRLFEGFISYKEQGKPSDHKRDVSLLRKAVKDRNEECFWAAEPLDNRDEITSAFALAGRDCGVPAIIKIDRQFAS